MRSVKSSSPQPSEQVTLNFTKLNIEYLGNHASSIHLTPSQISLP